MINGSINGTLPLSPDKVMYCALMVTFVVSCAVYVMYCAIGLQYVYHGNGYAVNRISNSRNY